MKRLTDEEVNSLFDHALDKGVNFDHKPTLGEIFTVRLKAIADAQIASCEEQAKEKREEIARIISRKHGEISPCRVCLEITDQIVALLIGGKG